MTHEMTKTRLPKNVADSVRENMPEYVGIELQTLLNRGMAVRLENQILVEENTILKDEIAQLEDLKLSDRMLKKRKGDLDELETKIRHSAESAVSDKLEYELKSERTANAFLKDICSVLAGGKTSEISAQDLLAYNEWKDESED